MSRNLPPHPNLDHLKKQAKELLHDLQQRDPASKLAHAQHALAREYGFASWPRLKVHVESLPGPAASTGAAPPEQANPFAGTWTANLSKSKRHPLNPFRSATCEIIVVGDTVTIADVVVNAGGQEEQSKNTIQADGHEHPGGGGYFMTAGWRGSHVLETVAKKDGQVVGQGAYEVSADGKTLTISGDEQRIVLDRQ